MGTHIRLLDRVVCTCNLRLSEHPKAAIHEHLKSGHTFRRNVQDIDSSGRVSSLSQRGES